jgi:hypothetical protein
LGVSRVNRTLTRDIGCRGDRIEVLVEVHAAAVTPGELAWDSTWQTADGADRTPIVPSHEFWGVIAQVGGDVSSLTPGTQVYGLIDFNHDVAHLVAPVRLDLEQQPPVLAQHSYLLPALSERESNGSLDLVRVQRRAP